MRLFLIPISTRRALIYARPLKREISKQLSLTDKITNKAATTWAQWEEADKGWKKHIVSWGNRVQQRIPFEEWGLKSIPSLNAQKRVNPDHEHTKVDVLYPGNAIRTEKLQSILRTIATARQDLHRRKMWWSFLASPLTAPVALIPLIPNIPFFYLIYRGWSHWRALNGSKHLEFLVERNLLNPVSAPELENLYAKRLSSASIITDTEKSHAQIADEIEQGEDRLLLEMSDARKLATILDAPELALEAERAIVQVREKLQAENKAAEEGQTEKKDI
ncbi:hypothetical protein ASPZODRAFT_58052 [Penicilliopsis zonata CBS 506.65]|uniref:Mitochondrial K+-H+ exchange-related-domain-containing protein n=1 Tax=Penicilliopsis zonata CBS 506.65 TaxID=1073090 RepID=A0A1L9SS05_9EURO|nr:hypothetical protein ASPZODRAFT_58052 [Penicilliopsis zonata CBS 506.65]OJJ49913.1 hypothetical protein ASPZODRAFT_58052 [Penicilliopsis zonata CBS 506.65]